MSELGYPDSSTRVGRFTLRQLSVVQWIGVVVAPLAWASQHVVGYGVGEARCSVAGAAWGISYDTWQLAIMAAARRAHPPLGGGGRDRLPRDARRRTTATARPETGAGPAPCPTRASTSSPSPRWSRTSSSSRSSSSTAWSPSSRRYARSPDRSRHRPRAPLGGACRGGGRHAEGSARGLRLPPLRRVLPQLPRHATRPAATTSRRRRPAPDRGARRASRAGSGRRCTASARSRPTSTSAPATCRCRQIGLQPRREPLVLGEHQIRALVAYVATLRRAADPDAEPGAREPLPGAVTVHRALRRLPPGRRAGRLRHGCAAAAARPRHAAPGRGGRADRPVRHAEVLAARDQRPAARLDRALRRVHEEPDPPGRLGARLPRAGAGGPRDLVHRDPAAARALL